MSLTRSVRTSREDERKRRALLFLNYRRRGDSVRDAGHKAGISARSAYATLPAAFEIGSQGRIVPKRSDRIERRLIFYDERGQTTILVRSSRDASRIARYHNAVDRWLRTVDARHLTTFEGKSVRDIDGTLHPYITDRGLLRRFAAAGEVRFESIYAFVGI